MAGDHLIFLCLHTTQSIGNGYAGLQRVSTVMGVQVFRNCTMTAA